MGVSRVVPAPPDSQSTSMRRARDNHPGTATVTGKYQITVPVAICRRLDLHKGDKVLAEVRGEDILFTPVKRLPVERQEVLLSGEKEIPGDACPELLQAFEDFGLAPEEAVVVVRADSVLRVRPLHIRPRRQPSGEEHG